MQSVMPEYVRKYMKDYPDGKWGVREDTPVEYKKRFEIWFNRNFSFDDGGKDDPWYTWDAKVIEKKDRGKRPEFAK